MILVKFTMSNVNRHGEHAVRWKGMVENPGYIIGDNEEGANGRMIETFITILRIQNSQL